MAKITTSAFDTANSLSSKEPVIVVKFEGIDIAFGSDTIYTAIRYDDPGVIYNGQYVYDGLRPLEPDKQKKLIDRAGSFSTISQKLEQWDGRASVETMNLKMVDFNQIFTQICSPGVLIEDILNRKVTIFYGYKTISFPEDYLVIFKGYVNKTALGQGYALFDFTDPSSKRKVDLFNQSSTVLTQAISFTDEVTFDYVDDFVLLSNHPFFDGDSVKFSVVGGSLPSPLVAGTQYYIINATEDDFQVSATLGGLPIDIVDPGPTDATFFISNYYNDRVFLSSTENVYRTILDVFGNLDTTVTIGLVIDNKEIVTYTNADILNSTTILVQRGQYGTEVQTHEPGVEVLPFLNLTDYPLNIALKAQLSGWNGPWQENVVINGIINNDAGGTTANSITFKQGVDLIRDYGVTIGSAVITSGSPIPANNGTWTVANIVNENRTIIVLETGILVQENPPTTVVAAFRSQYDTYPVTAGLELTPDDVLVSQYEYLRDTFASFIISLSIVGNEKSGKQWMENDLFKPIGAYSLTQGSRLSVGMTHAPLAVDLTKVINPDNVVRPQDIVVERGVNTRFFYNEVLFNYDYNPLTKRYNRTYRYVDANAQKRMRQVSVLEINMKGLNDSDESRTIMQQRAVRITQRYRYSAEIIKLKIFFGTGNTLDAGDVVTLRDTDPPTLQISNTEIGMRGITQRLCEVQERSIGLTNATTNVTLLSNNGFSFSSRYGTVGPSSRLDPTFSHTSSMVRIIDSFGAKFPGAEYKKWENFENSYIKIHNVDYSVVGVTKFTLDTFDPFIMKFSPALGFTPTDDMVIEFEDYDESSAAINADVKAQFVSLDKTTEIASGSSSTVFTLVTGGGARYRTSQVIYVMSPDGTRFSPDVKIIDIVGNIVTIGPVVTGATSDNTLGFTPQAGDLVQLGGFLDAGPGYRLV